MVTGSAWAGGGRRSIESGLRDIANSARQEMLGTIYSLAAFPDSVLEGLQRPMNRSVPTRLIVQGYKGQPRYARQRLESLAAPGAKLWIFDFDDANSALHAKLWIADRRRFLVGSANLSRRGLVANLELALMGDEPATGEALGAAFDDLLNSGYVSLVVEPR